MLSEEEAAKAAQTVGDCSFVRVIVLFPESEGLAENEWMQTAAQNEAFEFLHDSQEDIYTLDDGKPLNP